MSVSVSLALALLLSLGAVADVSRVIEAFGEYPPAPGVHGSGGAEGHGEFAFGADMGHIFGASAHGALDGSFVPLSEAFEVEVVVDGVGAGERDQ